jgi:hypothetical protein
MLYWILIVLVVIVVYIRVRKKHKFWDYQPVSRTKMIREGFISSTVPEPVPIKSLDTVVTVDPRDRTFRSKFAKFLSLHYVKDYNYDSLYISWFLEFPYLKKNNIVTLFKESTLIGSIISKPYDLCIKGKTIQTHYVDMLCVHRNFRNKNYAPTLISQTLKHSFKGNHKAYVYKIERKPLPFNYICKANYYIHPTNADISTDIYKLRRSTHDDIEYITHLYEKESVKYACFPTFDTDQMKYMCTSRDNVYESLVVMEGDVRRGVVMFSINRIHRGHDTIAELSLVLCEDIDYVEVMKGVIQYCYRLHIDMVICINIARNNEFIRAMDFNLGMDVYFHMYNYHLNEHLHPSKFLFNFM